MDLLYLPTFYVLETTHLFQDGGTFVNCARSYQSYYQLSYQFILDGLI